MIKLIVKYLIIGVAWGCFAFVANYILLDLTGSDHLLSIYENPTANALGLIVVCIGFFGGGIVYEIERLGLLLKLAIHIAVGTGLFLLVGFNIGWLTTENPAMIAFNIVFNVLILSVVWIASYFYDKRKVEKINQKLIECSLRKPLDTE